MKTAFGYFEKGHGTHKKKYKLFSRTKIETDVPNKKKFGRARKFCFTNIETILQECVPNKLYVTLFFSWKQFLFLFFKIVSVLY